VTPLPDAHPAQGPPGPAQGPPGPAQGPPGPAAGRHRSPDGDAVQRLTDLAARAGVGALIVAAITIGGVINSYTPDPDTRERPFSRTGAIGEQIDARTFDATVLGVRGGSKVSRSGKTFETGGVWIAVRVRLVAGGKAMFLGQAGIDDGRGHIYRQSDRVNQPLIGGRALQPDIPVEGEIFFEVPKNAATGLTILLSSSPFDERMDARAEVPLDIDQAKVDGWLKATEPIEVENAKVAT
jgi:hypothetical protein